MRTAGEFTLEGPARVAKPAATRPGGRPDPQQDAATVQPTRVWTAQPDGPAAEDRPNRPAYVQIGERRGGGDLAGALVQALQPAGPIGLAVGIADTRPHPDCTGVHGQPVREAGHPQGAGRAAHQRHPPQPPALERQGPDRVGADGQRPDRLASARGVGDQQRRASTQRAGIDTAKLPSSRPRAGSNTTTAPAGGSSVPTVALVAWGAPASPAPKFWSCRRPTTIRATSITTTPETSRQLRLDAFTPTPRPSVRPFC
jgi:hypothetical protein